ncbi:MAG: LysM peptidoglycan-binding domain-containing protein [Bacteroidota bacterium]
MRRRLLTAMLLIAVGIVFGTQWLAANEPYIENLDFVETDLRDVFRALGVAGQYNVLLTREVQGTISMSLRQRTTVKDAIELIARTYEFDLRWLEENKTVVIGKTGTLKSSFDTNSRLTKVFTLYYSTVTEIADALKVAVAANQLAVNPRTNQITVVGSALELENVEEIIAQMDHPMPQVNIEARMEEVVEDSMEELGLKWTASMDLGVGTGFSLVASSEISAKLTALETQNKAVLLAQPNASCLDSQEARIFIGDRYPITVTNIVNGQTQYSTSYVEIGTTLSIKPRVNVENVVTVTVKADVSSITKNVTTLAGEMPVIRTRSTESMARLKDGQTFVLTGLIRRDETTDTTGVPFLDKLPVLSVLFKNKRAETKNTVICVFLTPHIKRITPDEIPTVQSRVGVGVSGGLASLPTPAGTMAPDGGLGKGTPAPAATPASMPQASPMPEPLPAITPTQSPFISATPSPADGQAILATPAAATPPAAGVGPSPFPGLDPALSAEELAAVAGEADPAEAVRIPVGITATPTASPLPPLVPAPSLEPAEPTTSPSGEGTPAPTPMPLPTPVPIVSPAFSEMPAPTPPILIPVIMPSPAPTPAVAFGGGTAPAMSALPKPEDIRHVSYTVRKGDTLAAIGKKFGVPWEQIAAYNKISGKSSLRLGQTLNIPIPANHKYVVKPKETLWRIAKRYGVTTELLAEINGLADPTKIEVGQVIILPCPVDRVVNKEY